MNATHHLLFEIGVEEMPARFCQPALRQLATRTAAALAAARLPYGALETVGTPRRFVLRVSNLAAGQEDRVILVRGPARAAAFDAQGAPTRAAQGFARSQGVTPDDFLLHPDERGTDYVYVSKSEAGQSAAALLPALLADVVQGLDFPQTMRWGAGDMRFARPLRWLLCLLDESVIPVTIGGVVAGRATRGHRTLGPEAPIAVPSASAYAAICQSISVMADPAERSDIIWAQVQQIAQELGGSVPPHADLLAEITWLVEWPHAFSGTFDPAFLQVPAPVLVTSMREHQRYFPLYAAEQDRLLPAFIAVRNGGADHLDNVRSGNEKVLQARLSDARFFWDEDRKVPLASHLDGLRTVVFHNQLGSQFDRTARIRRLTTLVTTSLQADDRLTEQAERAADLSKCDLITQMVFEFPELQGIMGRAYALAEGIDPVIADAIAEHYQPRGAEDAPPTSLAGVAVAIADRLDTLAGFFGLGMVPTGSADPFALRRAAQGIIAIILTHSLRLSLDTMLRAALAGYSQFSAEQQQAACEALREFFRVRLDGLFRDNGARYDVVDAVLSAGCADIIDARQRIVALTDSLANPAFAAVTGSFKRIANIASKAEIDATLPFTSAELTGAERLLWDVFVVLGERAEVALTAADYSHFYQHLSGLKDAIDTFFTDVLIMDPDPTIRTRRLTMLRRIADLLTRPADLGRLAVG